MAANQLDLEMLLHHKKVISVLASEKSFQYVIFKLYLHREINSLTSIEIIIIKKKQTMGI